MYKFIIITLIILFTCGNTFANDDENQKYYEKKYKEIDSKCKNSSGIDLVNCWNENSPKKCKGLFYFSEKKAWRFCLYSCGSANFYSKTLGECSN